MLWLDDAPVGVAAFDVSMEERAVARCRQKTHVNTRRNSVVLIHRTAVEPYFQSFRDGIIAGIQKTGRVEGLALHIASLRRGAVLRGSALHV
jgi:hypothetical protein